MVHIVENSIQIVFHLCILHSAPTFSEVGSYYSIGNGDMIYIFMIILILKMVYFPSLGIWYVFSTAFPTGADTSREQEEQVCWPEEKKQMMMI